MAVTCRYPPLRIWPQVRKRNVIETVTRFVIDRRRIWGFESLGNSAEARKDTSPWWHTSPLPPLWPWVERQTSSRTVHCSGVLHIHGVFRNGESKGVPLLTVCLHTDCLLYRVPEQGSVRIFSTWFLRICTHVMWQ